MGLYERTISESSEDALVIPPLEFEDFRRGLEESERRSIDPRSSEDEQTETKKRSTMVVFSNAMGIKRKKTSTSFGNKNSLVKAVWWKAARKALALDDPWKIFHLDTLKTEEAIRHRYNALKQCWVQDNVFVKMEDTPFNNGAMRECFRMKKLSNFARSNDWSKAHNYVAKRYMDSSVSKETYTNDVKLQMDAKLWGEEFNRHNPPKQVDIFQMAILEMISRDGSPYYHVEHFLEGNYTKYNSNSGFVGTDEMRMTPQVFSHFSFERSGHELIVVDIQGVGDLYTDPQIHTSVGTDYGDGNLGTRGMALFLHSHICSPLCKSLGLTQFDLSPSELLSASKAISKDQMSSKTVAKGSEQITVPIEDTGCSRQDYVRLRSASSGYMSGEEAEFIESAIKDCGNSFDDLNPLVVSDDTFTRATRKSRIRNDSATDYGENAESTNNALQSFKEMVKRKARPSHVLKEEDHLKMLESLESPEVKTYSAPQNSSMLGQIHMDMAKYHELNRFTDESETYDQESALFHVQISANCQNLTAILTIAQLHQGLPHDILPDIELDENERDPGVAFKYLMLAAEAGDRSSMVKVAKLLDNGIGLPPSQSIDWKEAVNWYDKAVNTDTTDSDGNYDGTMNDPSYQLIARQAEMYLLGNNNLLKDPNQAGELFTTAADLAMEAMKGKLASKYYIRADEAWGEAEM